MGDLWPPVVVRRRAMGYLTARQLEVLALVAEGFSNSEIAAQLVVSPDTVRCHVRAILDGLDARTRAHAVTRAFQAGVLTIDHGGSPG